MLHTWHQLMSTELRPYKVTLGRRAELHVLAWATSRDEVDVQEIDSTSSLMPHILMRSRQVRDVSLAEEMLRVDELQPWEAEQMLRDAEYDTLLQDCLDGVRVSPGCAVVTLDRQYGDAVREMAQQDDTTVLQIVRRAIRLYQYTKLLHFQEPVLKMPLPTP